MVQSVSSASFMALKPPETFGEYFWYPYELFVDHFDLRGSKAAHAESLTLSKQRKDARILNANRRLEAAPYSNHGYGSIKKLKQALKDGADPNYNGGMALRRAALSSSASAVSILLSAGADPNLVKGHNPFRDNRRISALTVAYGRKPGHHEVHHTNYEQRAMHAMAKKNPKKMQREVRERILGYSEESLKEWQYKEGCKYQVALASKYKRRC